jgi:hypothetical protein
MEFIGICEYLSVRYIERNVRVKFLFWIQLHAIKVYEGMELLLQLLFSLALVSGQLHISRIILDQVKY